MRSFGTAAGVLALVLGVAVSVLLLYMALYTDNFVLQIVLLLASMGLLFFSTHPLAHYVVARLYGIQVMYFFLGKSDFRKLGGKLGMFGNLIPTIGTKIDVNRVQGISKRRRSLVYGAGAIVSNVAILLPLLTAWFFGLNPIALVLGTLFFLGSLGSEVLFSSKVGDLSKMKRELAK
jgi:hypothetical protein